MRKDIENTKIPVEIEFTDGYQERFTNAVLKIYEKRIRQEEQINSDKDDKTA